MRTGCFTLQSGGPCAGESFHFSALDFSATSASRAMKPPLGNGGHPT
jgi:hypothetical protein